MIPIIYTVTQIDPLAEIQIFDRGYGQIETYRYGNRHNKVFLDPATLNQFYSCTEAEEQQKYLS